jgi:preprotein translocase subunit SecE
MTNDTKERIKDYTLAIIIGVALATILFYGLSS